MLDLSHSEVAVPKRAVGAPRAPASAPAVLAVGSARQWARVSRVTLLIVVDMLAVLAAAVLGYYLWAGLVLGQRPGVYVELLPLVVLFPLANAVWGLYPGFGLGAVETIRRLNLISLFIFLTLAGANYAFKIPHQYSRITFGLTLLGILILMPLARFAALSLTRRWPWWAEECVIVGSGEVADRAVKSLRRARSIGYRPIAVVTVAREEAVEEIGNLPVMVGSENLPILARSGVRVALVAEQTGGLDIPDLVSFLQRHYRHVIVLRGQMDIPVEGVEVKNFGGIFGLEFVNQLLRIRNRVVKRSMDIVLGSLLLPMAIPMILFAAVVVKVTSKGPAFFSQKRIGLRGKQITVWKLRTMFADADTRLEAYLQQEPSARDEWHSRFKLKDDPRVLPRVGRLLRRFSIDELPQLWSVVKGDMSLVGPRPFPLYHLAGFSDEFRELRRCVRPGVTGLWQVMIRGEGSSEEQESYDTYYIRNWSLWMDLYILTRTLFAVMRGAGAY